jgi:hypothetical protein
MFTFLCPDDRVDEAVEVLSAIEGIKVFPYEEEAFQLTTMEGRKIKAQRGREISGICKDAQVAIVIKELSKRKIAGFDDFSTILFRDVLRH